MVPLEWVNLQWNFPQLGFKSPASHKGSGRFLWTRTTLGLFVESFKHFILLQYARKSGERLFCRESNLMHQQFVTCSEHPIWKEMVSLMSMASMPPPNHTQSWGLFVAKQQFFFKR